MVAPARTAKPFAPKRQAPAMSLPPSAHPLSEFGDAPPPPATPHHLPTVHSGYAAV